MQDTAMVSVRSQELDLKDTGEPLGQYKEKSLKLL